MKVFANLFRAKSDFLVGEYRDLIHSRAYIISLVLATSAFFAAYVANYYAGTYATLNATRFVEDLILSNTVRVDTEAVHLAGASLLRWFVVFLFILYPRRVPFILKSLAVLIFVRCVFINLTHLGMYPGVPPMHSNITFGGDLYFSGHVAIPLLLAWIFWDKTPLRYIFFVTSFGFAISTLLGHYHYSIDVFSAPFFAHGTFAACKRLFAGDWARACAST